MKAIRIFLVLCLAGFSICTVYSPLYAQNRVYANYIADSSSDFHLAHLAIDAQVNNFAYINAAAGVLSSSHLTFRFPQSGKAGDAITVQVQSLGLLGAGVLNNITLHLYDSTGVNVANVSGSSLLQLSLLSSGNNIYSVHYITDINSNYTFNTVEVELNNLLSVNLLSEFRIYSVFFQPSCPAVKANSVHAYGTNLTLTGFVTNANDAVDADPTNYATLNCPLNLLGLLPPAYLDLSFGIPGNAGEYVGFTVSQSSTLITLGVLSNLSITAYDGSNNVVASQSGFTLLDLKLLNGTSNKYTLGFITPAGSYTINRLKINMTGVIGVLESINVHDAFHYRIDATPVAISASSALTFCKDSSVVLSTNVAASGNSFLWSNGATTPTITVSQSGNYSVKVTDGASCVYSSVPVVVKELSDIAATVNITHLPCNSLSNGAAQVEVPDSIGAYTLVWSNGSTSDSVTAIASGSNSVTITQTSTGCITSLPVQLNEQAPIAATLNVSNVTCNGLNNGATQIKVPNSIGAYTLLWNTGSTNDSVTAMSPGNYSVAITKTSDGCVTNLSVQINEPAPLTFTAAVSEETCHGNDARISLETSGGTASYTFTSSAGSIQGDEVTNLNKGTYTVTVTDAHACTYTANIPVAKVDCSTPINIHDVITPNSDGFNDVLVIEGIERYPNSDLMVFDKWGDMVYKDNAYDNTWKGSSKDKEQHLPAGTYFYILKLNAAEVPNGKSDYTGYILIQR